MFGGDRAFLYCGHMIDQVERREPRFPPSHEHAVRLAIESQLDSLAVDRLDAAVGGAASGADIMFAEAFLRRGAAVRIHLPVPPREFLSRSVAFAGSSWVERFHVVIARAFVSVATHHSGLRGENIHEQVNEIMLKDALSLSPHLVLVCVWDGRVGDGPGGTQHMVDQVESAGGCVHRIDPTRLASAP